MEIIRIAITILQSLPVAVAAHCVGYIDYVEHGYLGALWREESEREYIDYIWTDTQDIKKKYEALQQYKWRSGDLLSISGRGTKKYDIPYNRGVPINDLNRLLIKIIADCNWNGQLAINGATVERSYFTKDLNCGHYNIIATQETKLGQDFNYSIIKIGLSGSAAPVYRQVSVTSVWSSHKVVTEHYPDGNISEYTVKYPTATPVVLRVIYNRKEAMGFVVSHNHDKPVVVADRKALKEQALTNNLASIRELLISLNKYHRDGAFSYLI